MKTIEELQKEHETALAKLKREHEIAASLPLPPDRVMLCRKMAPWVTYKVTSLASALEVFQAFAAVGQVRNMEHASGTFTHLCPASDRGERDRVEHKGDYCAALDVRQGQGFGPSATLMFYVGASSGLCRVNVDIESKILYKLGARVEEIRIPGRSGKGPGCITERRYSLNPILNGYSDSFISYATGDLGRIKTGAHYVYLWVSDDGETCKEFSHFLGQLENLAAELEPKP